MKPNAPEPIPKINVAERLLQVWTNTAFLKTVLYPEGDKAVGRTWAFWFLWNTVIAVGLTIALWFVWAQSSLQWVEQEWWPTVPEFEVKVEDGKFSTNLAEPYVVFDEEGMLAVIDTQGVEYTEDSLRGYQGGVVVAEDQFTVKEENGQFQTFYFSDFEENITLTKAEAELFWYEAKPSLIGWLSVLAFVGIWFWLCIFRLLTAVWWALIFWGIGNMAGLPDWTFPKSYLSVLNFYIIPLLFELLLLLVGVGMVPFSTLLVFGLVFGLNFYSFRNTPDKEEAVQPD